jgi:hypothetical protein
MLDKDDRVERIEREEGAHRKLGATIGRSLGLGFSRPDEREVLL